MERNAAAGFTGAYRDGASFANPLGNGYRWYLPWLMRFNAPDSWSPFGAGGPNAYAYCAADPINRSDPSGHMRTGLSGISQDLTSQASNIADQVTTRSGTQEAGSSLAADASERAAQDSTDSTPSTSGDTNVPASRGAPGAMRGSVLSRRRARFNVGPLAVPTGSSEGPPVLGEVTESMRRYRRGAVNIESRATALETQWISLVRDSRSERGELGRPESTVAHLARQAVQRLLEDTNGLLGDLHELQTRLGQNPGEFTNQQAEIQSLQGRLAPIAGRVSRLNGRLRLEINQSSESAFRFNLNRNEN